MDPFQSLPSSILEMVLKLLPDLPTLHSLHNATPAVASLLHEDGVAPVIVEAIISESGRLPLQTQALIRTIVFLHWRTSSSSSATMDNPLPSTWDAFTSPFSQQGRGGRPIPPSFGDARLPTSTTPTTLCHVFALSARVRQLTHAYLHVLIARCMALQPAHLKNPRFRYRYKATFEQRQARPPGRTYQPVDVGAPSWVEEQRVARAVWRVVLFFELRRAVVTHALAWPEEDVRRLRGMGVEEFWDGLLILGELQELRMATEWMFPASGEAAAETEKGDERVPSWMVSSSGVGEEWLYCCEESRPATEDELRDAQNCLSSCSPGYFFGRTALANLPSSPLRHVDFAVFQPYGFAVWDLKRMMALGFLDSHNREDAAENPPLSESNIFFTWASILTNNQLEEVDRRQREHWSVP